MQKDGQLQRSNGKCEWVDICFVWRAIVYEYFMCCSCIITCRYRNGKIIPGATKAELELTLYSPIHGHRAYRCVRCKMVARSVPVNAYHIICGNCSYQFTYREVGLLHASYGLAW